MTGTRYNAGEEYFLSNELSPIIIIKGYSD
jgi:hypothetical protein